MITSPTNGFNSVLFILDLDLAARVLSEVPVVATTGGGLPTWLIFAFLLFFAGLLGMIFNFKNFLVTMMSVELMYLGAVTSFVLYGTICHDPRGSVYGLMLLIVAACESAIGLGILIVLYRFERTIDFSAFEELGG